MRQSCPGTGCAPFPMMPPFSRPPSSRVPPTVPSVTHSPVKPLESSPKNSALEPKVTSSDRRQSVRIAECEGGCIRGPGTGAADLGRAPGRAVREPQTVSVRANEQVGSGEDHALAEDGQSARAQSLTQIGHADVAQSADGDRRRPVRDPEIIESGLVGREKIQFPCHERFPRYIAKKRRRELSAQPVLAAGSRSARNPPKPGADRLRAGNNKPGRLYTGAVTNSSACDARLAGEPSATGASRPFRPARRGPSRRSARARRRRSGRRARGRRRSLRRRRRP